MTLPSTVNTPPRKVLKKRKRKPKNTDNVTLGWILLFALLLLGCLGGYHSIMNWQREQQTMYEEKLREKLDPMTREWEEKMVKLQEEKDILAGKDSSNKEALDGLQRQVNKWKKKTEKLEASIERLSRAELIQRFGEGPHYVEIQLEFPPEAEIEGTEDKILLEMAPVADMPLAVYWFLRQVDLELYDDCSFHRNAPHVIQGGPTPNFLSPKNPKLHQRFHNSGFESIPYQEYSPNFPHKEYTVGYAGRPGGPDFYISIQDNTEAHGPGGQAGYEDTSEADPCFARVVEGFEAVQRMKQSPVQPGEYNHMVYNIAITSMRIVGRGEDEDHDDR